MVNPDSLAEIPQDGDWIIAVILLADAAAGIGDPVRSRVLYELLAPYRERIVVIGLAAVCLCALARFLGRLALAAGDRAAALEHFEAALQINADLRASVQLAHTQLDYALALRAGPRARSLVASAQRLAAELHLPAVARRAEQIAGD